MRLVALAPAALLVLAGCGSSTGPVHSAHPPTAQTKVAPVALECLPSSNGSTRQADLEAYIGDIVASSNLEIDGVGVVDLGTNAPSVKGHFFVIAGLASPSRHYFNWVADQAFVNSGTGHIYPLDAPTRAASLNTSSSPVSAPQVAIATADACADANYAKSSPLPPLPSATPTPAPTACAVLSCEMSVNSNVHGIPLPSDAAPQGSGWTSHLADIQAFTSFYVSWMTNAGWTYEPQTSNTDPEYCVTHSCGGYASDTEWCQSTTGFPDVAITVASGSDVDRGKNVWINFVDNTGLYDTCP